MTFGPDQVIACPRCQAPERVFTLASSNGLGFAAWTDGFSSNSMAWEPPEIVACHACEGFFWLEDAPVLGRMPDANGTPELWFGESGLEELPVRQEPVSPEWEQAPKVCGLGAEGYRFALESDVVSTPERLFRLRLLTFWNSNHRNRNLRKKKVRQKVPWETKNLKELLQLRIQRFDEGHDAADAVAIAEMHRELGAYQDCLEWLARVEDVEGIAPFVAKVQELAKSGSVCVEWVRGAPFAPDDRKAAEPMIRMLRKMRESEKQDAASGRTEDAEPPVVLVTASRPVPDPGVEYVAYFKEAFREDEPRLLEMMAFARRIGSCLGVNSETHPFAGMKSAISLGTLTEDEVSEFKQLFLPDQESAIPIL